MSKESLPDAVYDDLRRCTDRGNAHMDRREWADAIAAFESALPLLPEPKSQWTAYMWIMASIGDAWFMQGDLVRAEIALTQAARNLDGQQNPFVMLRLGQVSFELGEMPRADDCLMRAYMLAGMQAFDGEDTKYAEHLRAKFDIR